MLVNHNNMSQKDFTNARNNHKDLKLFSEDELYQIFSRTKGVCHKCTKLIQLEQFMSDGNGSWFIINSRNKPVYGKNEHNLHQLRPVCSKCLDEITIEDASVRW
jgi:hypothetical protein